VKNNHPTFHFSLAFTFHLLLLFTHFSPSQNS
jgi:hypothetical protein